MKQAILGIIVVIAIITGAVLFGKEPEVAGEPSNNVYGLQISEITLTEYGDFECPGCAFFYPIVAQVKEQFKDQVRFEFKHFPLVERHANATAAHRAAEAAAKQGKFWEMHDLLFERQVSWQATGVDQTGRSVSNNNPTAVFEQYAQEIGLDVEKYKSDARLSETLATINADIALGKAAGVSATPTFYLNGKLIEDTSTINTVEKLAQLLQQEIDKSKNPNSADNSNAEPATTTQ